MRARAGFLKWGSILKYGLATAVAAGAIGAVGLGLWYGADWIKKQIFGDTERARAEHTEFVNQTRERIQNIETDTSRINQATDRVNEEANQLQQYQETLDHPNRVGTLRVLGRSEGQDRHATHNGRRLEFWDVVFRNHEANGQDYQVSIPKYLDPSADPDDPDPNRRINLAYNVLRFQRPEESGSLETSATGSVPPVLTVPHGIHLDGETSRDLTIPLLSTGWNPTMSESQMLHNVESFDPAPVIERLRSLNLVGATSREVPLSAEERARLFQWVMTHREEARRRFGLLLSRESRNLELRPGARYGIDVRPTGDLAVMTDDPGEPVRESGIVRGRVSATPGSSGSAVRFQAPEGTSEPSGGEEDLGADPGAGLDTEDIFNRG